jgi:hypothetical protein
MQSKRRKRTHAARRKRNPPSISRHVTEPNSPAPTATTNSLRADLANVSLLLGALALSYLLPFELLIVSYAVLGPAHYLTEISWLHDRRYFLPHRGLALLLCVVALGAMFMADSFWLGVLISFSFVACAILAIAHKRAQALVLLALAAGSFAVLCTLRVPFGIAWVLVPSVIHVSVFTLVFMTLGAYKSRSVAQSLLVAVYLVAVAIILVLPPSQATVVPQLAKLGKDYFGDIAPALGSLFGIPDLKFDGRITGLLSFVYTYHYLNWFIKADVIRWNDISRARLAVVATFSIAATGLYFYNYVYGFMVLLLLSLIHVMLEFPLNAISLHQLGSSIGASFVRVRTAKAGAG